MGWLRKFDEWVGITSERIQPPYTEVGDWRAQIKVGNRLERKRPAQGGKWFHARVTEIKVSWLAILPVADDALAMAAEPLPPSSTDATAAARKAQERAAALGVPALSHPVTARTESFGAVRSAAEDLTAMHGIVMPRDCGIVIVESAVPPGLHHLFTFEPAPSAAVLRSENEALDARAEGTGVASASLSRALIAAHTVRARRTRTGRDRAQHPPITPTAAARVACAAAAAAASAAAKDAAAAGAAAVRNRSAPAPRTAGGAAARGGAKRLSVSSRFLKLALRECECPSAPDLQMVWAAYDADDSGALSIGELALVLRDIMLDRATALRRKTEQQKHMSAFTLARISALDRRVSAALVRLLDDAPVEVLAERLFVVIEGNADIDATATALANAALAAVLPDAVAAAHAAAAASSAAAASAARDALQTEGSPQTLSLIKRRSLSTTRVASVVALIARFRDAYRYVVETYVARCPSILSTVTTFRGANPAHNLT